MALYTSNPETERAEPVAVVGTRQHYGGTVIYLRKTGSDDADDSFVPVFVVQDDGTAVGKPFQSGNNLVGLFGHGFVEVFAGFVVLVDLSCLFQSKREVFLRQQVYCFLAVLDASRSVDSRTYLENDVADGNLFSTPARIRR